MKKLILILTLILLPTLTYADTATYQNNLGVNISKNQKHMQICKDETNNFLYTVLNYKLFKLNLSTNEVTSSDAYAYIAGVAVDTSSNVYISSSGAIRKLNSTTFSTVLQVSVDSYTDSKPIAINSNNILYTGYYPSGQNRGAQAWHWNLNDNSMGFINYGHSPYRRGAILNISNVAGKDVIWYYWEDNPERNHATRRGTPGGSYNNYTTYSVSRSHYIADDSSGNFYRASGSAIYKYDSNYSTNTYTFTNTKTSLSAIFIDQTNNIYVGNRNEIIKYNSSFEMQAAYNLNIFNHSSFAGAIDVPIDIATDSNGNIYVSDKYDGIIMFNSSQEFVRRIGSSGVGTGAFHEIKSLAIDSNDNIYAIDINGHRVYKFSNTGTLLGTWGKNNGDGTSGTGDSEFTSPSCITIDSNDNIFVGDSGRIQKFNSSMEYQTSLATNNHELTYSPITNRIYTSYSTNKVFYCDTNLENYTTMTITENATRVEGISIDSQGYIYLCDTTEDNIYKYNSDHEYIGEFQDSSISTSTPYLHANSGKLYLATDPLKVYSWPNPGPSAVTVTDTGTTTLYNKQLTASWTAGTSATQYQYSIGTSAGATDNVDWTSVGTARTVTKYNLSLSATSYYFNVKYYNGEQWSQVGSSDGITVITPISHDSGTTTVTENVEVTDRYYTIGESSTAALNISDSIDITTNRAIIGDGAGSDGEVVMGLNASKWNSTDFYIGNAGSAYFRHRGGAVNITSTFKIGAENGSNGDYDIEGGTLVAPTITIGESNGSDGNMEIKGGSVSANSISLASASGSTARLVISDGTMQVNTISKGAGNSSISFTGGMMKVNTAETNITNTQGIFNPNIGQGEATISGNYTNEAGGTIQIELASDSEYDSLNIDGTFDVNGGDLEVLLVAAYEPAAGTSFGIITCDTLDGSWSDLTMSLPRLTTPNVWEIATSSTTCTISVSASGLTLDSDNDGVSDSVDLYPQDETAAFDQFSPAGSLIGTLGFEDRWPTKGDMDCNDLVMGYKYNYLSTTDNTKITELSVFYVLRAVGGNVNLGFGIQFDELGVATTNIERVVLRKNNGAETIPDSVSGASKLSYIIFNNAHSEMGVSSGYANTSATEGTNQTIKTKLPTYELCIEFSPPVDASILAGETPHNPFVFYSNNTTREIHLIDKPHTTKSNEQVLEQAGNLDVPNNQHASITYKTADNFPWALNIPMMWDFPTEKGSIDTAYPEVITWASGGDAESWYSNPSGESKTSFSTAHNARVQGDNLSYSLKRKFGLADK